MVTNFPAMLVKQIFRWPLNMRKKLPIIVTSIKLLFFRFALNFFTKMLLVIWDLMILQLSDFLNQFLIVLIGGLNKEEFFFFELD